MSTDYFRSTLTLDRGKESVLWYEITGLGDEAPTRIFQDGAWRDAKPGSAGVARRSAEPQKALLNSIFGLDIRQVDKSDLPVEAGV